MDKNIFLYKRKVGEVRKIEQPIRELGSHADEAAKFMLQSVVEKKRKLNSYEKILNYWKWMTFLSLAMFFIYLTLMIIQPNQTSTWGMISAFFDQTLHLLFLLFIFAQYGTVLYLKKKKDKAEDEFHAIRCEIIRKSIELWPQPSHWKERLHVYETMKKHFDINLYHEHK
jgi:hypothetical protein